MDPEVAAIFGKHITPLDDLPPHLREIALRERADEDVAEMPVPGESDIAPIDFVDDAYPFTIGGVDYEVRELVLEQERQLVRLIRETNIKLSGPVQIELGKKKIAETAEALLAAVDYGVFLDSLDAKAATFFAVLLTPKGQHVKDKNPAEVEEHLRWELTVSQQIEVVRCFFGLLTDRAKAALKRVIVTRLRAASA